MNIKDILIDLTDETDKGNRSVTLENDDDLKLIFSGDVENQIKITESGDNIVVTAYGLEKADWYEYSTITSPYKETKGKNKGKYLQETFISSYNEETEHWSYVKTESKYVKKKGTGEYSYIYKKIGETSGTVYETTSDPRLSWESETVVNEGDIFAEVTYTNGKDLEHVNVNLTSDIYADAINLINYDEYAPVYDKKKKAYVGNWLNETTASTSANEKFILNGGENTINYDMTQYVGKDTIELTKDSSTILNFNGIDGSFYSNAKIKGNDVLVDGYRKLDNPYEEKLIVTVAKNPMKSGAYKGKYKATVKVFYFDAESGTYIHNRTQTEYATKAELSHAGAKIGKTTSIYYDDDTETYTKNAPKTQEYLGQIVLKNYISNGVDNVINDDHSFKYDIEYMLENNAQAKYSSQPNKKQNIKGTWLDEFLVGGKKNDKITTGSGNDNLVATKGKDTYTINGTGTKEFWGLENVKKSVNTIKFDKNTNFANTSLVFDLDDFDEEAYMKKGNDLVIDETFYDRINKIMGFKPEGNSGNKVIIKDFFKNDAMHNSVIFDGEVWNETTQQYDEVSYTFEELNQNDESGLLFIEGNAKKANKLTDTKYNDGIIGGNKKDTITLANAGYDMIMTAKGNDTVNIKASATGEKVIYDFFGSGKDTLNIESGYLGSVLIQNMAMEDWMDESGKVNFEFQKTGDNLLLKSTYKKGTSFEGLKIKKNITDILTVKNYFANDYNIDFEYEYYDEYEHDYSSDRGDLADVLNDTGKLITINSSYNKKQKTYYYDGTKYQDQYTYSGKNKAVMTDDTGVKSNDTYNVKVTSKSNLTITDNGGKDTINLSNKFDTTKIFFDVVNTGTAESPEYEFQGDLSLFVNAKTLSAKNAKTALTSTATGSVKLNNFGQYLTGEKLTVYAQAGDGTSTNYTERYVDTIHGIVSEVAAWLSSDANTQGFGSVNEVLNSNDQTAITAIMDCYTRNYDEYLS